MTEWNDDVTTFNLAIYEEEAKMKDEQKITDVIDDLARRIHYATPIRDLPFYDVLRLAFNAGAHFAVVHDWDEEDLLTYLEDTGAIARDDAAAFGPTWTQAIEDPRHVSVFSEPILEQGADGVLHEADSDEPFTRPFAQLVVGDHFKLTYSHDTDKTIHLVKVITAPTPYHDGARSRMRAQVYSDDGATIYVLGETTGDPREIVTEDQFNDARSDHMTGRAPSDVLRGDGPTFLE